MTLPPPAPGRDCGECIACCVDLLIDVPELRKPDGVACPNLTAGDCNRCGVYETRPTACSTWHCGWRLLSSLSDAMRPDRCGVMLVPEVGTAEGYATGGLMLVPLGGDIHGVTNPELVDLAAKCVIAGVPIYLSHGVGEAGRRLLTNPLLEPAARAGDRAGFVAGLTWAICGLAAAAGADKPSSALRQWGSGPVRVRVTGAQNTAPDVPPSPTSVR